MFTGIVEDLGSLLAMRRGAESARLRIATGLPLDEVRVGDSIAVDGCCLTVVEKDGASFDVEAAAETLRVTTLGARAPGDPLHLERALRFGGRLDGHLVSGHIDSVGEITRLEHRGPALKVTIAAPAEVLRYVVVKGSISIDGVSLTVNELDLAPGGGGHFCVLLIPHTLTATHLGKKAAGGRVNLEVDLVGKYVERLVKPWRIPDETAPARGVTLAFLQAHGYAKE